MVGCAERPPTEADRYCLFSQLLNLAQAFGRPVGTALAFGNGFDGLSVMNLVMP